MYSRTDEQSDRGSPGERIVCYVSRSCSQVRICTHFRLFWESVYPWDMLKSIKLLIYFLKMV